MTTYLAPSKSDFIDTFEEKYALHAHTSDDLRRVIGSMTCVRLINPDIQPWPDFDTDDIEEIADEVFNRLHSDNF